MAVGVKKATSSKPTMALSCMHSVIIYPSVYALGLHNII